MECGFDGYVVLRNGFKEWRGEDGWLRLYCPHCDVENTSQNREKCCKKAENPYAGPDRDLDKLMREVR